MSNATTSQRLFIGTSNPHPGVGDGAGIFAAFLRDGQLSEPQLVAAAVSPSFLACKPGTASPLYAIVGGDNGNATATSYTTAAPDEAIPQTLERIAQADCGSPGGCQLAISADGRILLSANYTGATTASFLAEADGTLRVADVVAVPPEAEKKAHPHCAHISPDGNFVLVNDLGLDRIHIYRLEAATGRLLPHTPDHWASAAGAGPRHTLLHPNGTWIYNINQLNSTIDQLAWDASAGTLTTLRTIDSVPPAEERTTPQACEVIFSHDLRFLYASNRVHQSFAVFAIDPATGALSLIQELMNPGIESRHIALDATGAWFLSANQFSGDISIFPVDTASGMLQPRSSYVTVDGPSYLLFV